MRDLRQPFEVSAPRPLWRKKLGRVRPTLVPVAFEVMRALPVGPISCRTARDQIPRVAGWPKSSFRRFRGEMER